MPWPGGPEHKKPQSIKIINLNIMALPRFVEGNISLDNQLKNN